MSFIDYNWKLWLKKAIYDDTCRLHSFLIQLFSKQELESVLNYLKDELFKIRPRNQDDVLVIIPYEPRDWVKKTLSKTFDPSRQGKIYIDDIRKIKEFLSQKPSSFGFKIVFVMDAEKLNREAANAFLKILEEQPEYAFIFLFTQNSDLLPKTIVSRLIKLSFNDQKDFKAEGSYNIRDFLNLALVDKFDFCDKFLYHKEKAAKFLDELMVFLASDLESKENNYKLIKELIRYKKVLIGTNQRPQFILKNIILNVLERESV